MNGTLQIESRVRLRVNQNVHYVFSAFVFARLIITLPAYFPRDKQTHELWANPHASSQDTDSFCS